MIGALLTVHSVFFENFYMSWKTDKLQTELNKFADNVSSNKISYTEYMKLKQKIMAENNAFINVVDENGESFEQALRKNQEWYTVVIEYQNKVQKKIVISEYDIFMYLQGKEMEVESCYYIMSGSIDEHYQYILGLMDCETYDIMNNNMVEIESGNGIILNVSPIWNQIKVINISKALPIEIQSRSFSIMDNNTIVIGDAIGGTGFGFAVSPFDTIDQIKMDKTVDDYEGKKLKFFLTASLQPIDEASAAITSYYPWFFLVAVFTALIVAYAYSRYVSKPIIKISKAANEMAEGRLDTRIESRQNNEIGILSKSLNLLSQNLQSSLDELQEANVKLLRDIAEKEHQEEIRREFTDNVSHELKTPLGVMRCYVELLRDNMEPDKHDEYYDIILAEINKMNKMVLQMLQLAKAESGDIKLDKSVFSIEDMTKDVVTMFRPILDTKNMDVNIVGNFGDIDADEQRIEQVLTNIVGNAVKYGLDGTTIEIVGTANNDKYKFSILNKCNSISQDKADELFKRFYMLDKSRNEDGTGLGLAICAAIFELHDFEYGVISHGDSIEFWFEYN